MDAAGFTSTQLQRAMKKTHTGSARGSGLALAPQFPAHQAELAWDSRPRLCSSPAGSEIQTTLQLLSQNGQRPLGCRPPPPNKAASVDLRDDCPKASQEKSSTWGQQSRENWQAVHRKVESTVWTQFNEGFTGRLAGSGEKGAHHSRARGLAGRWLEAVKNGQRSQVNNSGSALGLLPRPFDFYKLTIPGNGKHKNSPAGEPCDGWARFPSGTCRLGGWTWPPVAKEVPSEGIH